MSAHVDLERRLIVASVGDLLADGEQRSIGLGGGGRARLWIGQELHRRVQQDRLAEDPRYRVEVPVQAELALDGWTLRLSGRADGVMIDDARPVRVDEIKTLHFAVDLYHLFADERLERHRHQVRLYALMLSDPARPTAAELVLVDIVTGEERREEVSWSPDGVMAWLRHRLHRLVAEEQRRVRRLAELRQAAPLVPFPYPLVRPAQEVIRDAVGEALTAGRHLLVRAPTGCGKTAAALHPAVQVALARGQRVVYLTAKTLQQRMAVATVRTMGQSLFRSLQLRAKTKMCAHVEMICHEEHCPYAREYGLKLVRSRLLANLLEQHPHLDPDTIAEAARAHVVCPFEVSLDLLGEVDVVVCDYNYVFDPTVGLGALLGPDALHRAILVIDEAHNLVDRSREYYSPILELARIERAVAFTAQGDAPVLRRLHGLLTDLAGLVAETVGDALGDTARGEREIALPCARLADLRIELDGAVLQYFLYKREREMWLADDPVLDVFFDLSRLQRVVDLDGEELVHLAVRGEDGAESLRVLCLDASRFLAPILEECAGAVAMSATLEPFGFYRDLLGFEAHRTDELHVPSPFPPCNRLVVAIDDVDTAFRRRAAHADAIAAWIARLAQPGRNVLTLFPSYAFLSAVRDRLPVVPHELVWQEAGALEDSQHALLAALGNGRAHLLLAVLGGIFAEGVDYPGRMLEQVIVVSPGLPQFNSERERLKAFYQERYGHGFSYAYLIPGLTRVVQAAGRLIRSEEDRGVIVLMCRRFVQPRYAELLPEEWTEGDPTTLLHSDPAAAVRAFFAASSRSEQGYDGEETPPTPRAAPRRRRRGSK